MRAQGKLEIEGGNAYDWGTADPGVLKATVQLKNVGNGDLSILEVRRTCLCTVPSKLEKSVLKPGESTPLNIQLDVAGQNGAVSRSILIRSVDSAASATKEDSTWLQLHVTVRREVLVSPALSVIVGNGKVGEEARALPLKVKNQGDAPITVWPPMLEDGASVTLRCEMYRGTTKLEKEVVLQPGEEFELRSYVTPLLSGQMRGRVIMKTSSGKLPVVVLGAVAARPSMVAEAAKAHQPGTAH